MPDPFDALRAPLAPADPDPAFAARLRARLERALDLPEGVAVTDIAVPLAGREPPPEPYGHRWMLRARLPAAAGGAGRALRQGDVGYASLWVPDVARAAAFYASVLGLAYVPAQGARGRQATGVTPPQGLWEGHAHPTLFCSYVVDDAAGAVARVRAAGGEADEPVRQPYGLSADCVDVDGVRFAVHQPPAATPGAAPPVAGHDGDLIYVTLEVPDSARTLAFYSAVLGWRYHRGRVPDGWQIEDTTPMIGVSGGHAAAASVPVWRAADVASAVGRVRAAGGTSTDPHQEPYGLIAECTDDQGTRFSLTQFPG